MKYIISNQKENRKSIESYTTNMQDDLRYTIYIYLINASIFILYKCLKFDNKDKFRW